MLRQGYWRSRWPTRRQLANRRGNCGLRAKARNQFLDLALAPVPGGIEDLAMVLGREVRPQQTDRSHRERAVGEQLEDDGITPRRPRGLHTKVSGIVGEAQHLRAVGEQRGTALAEIQAARIDLAEQRNQVRDRTPLVRGGAFDFDEQAAIGETGDISVRRHAPL